MSEHQPQPPTDPSGIEEPHDVLAADEFAIGAREERFPPDPTGIQEPHDVLAAEEFAMPAGAEPHEHGGLRPLSLLPLLAVGLLLAALALLALRRRQG